MSIAIPRIRDLSLTDLAAPNAPWFFVGQLPNDNDENWSYRTGAVQTVKAMPAVGGGPDAFLAEDWAAWALRKRDGGAFANTVLLGRAASNDVSIAHSSISKLHARARFVGESAYLQDAGSSNGTLVNGDPLAEGEERLLLTGDLVRLGTCLFQLFSPEHLGRLLTELRRRP